MAANIDFVHVGMNELNMKEHLVLITIIFIISNIDFVYMGLNELNIKGKLNS